MVLHTHTHTHTHTHARAQWTSDPEERVTAVGKYPDQTSLQRKEQLYMDAVRLFNEGKSWECGVPLCKELATLYETQLYDYTKLASILVRIHTAHTVNTSMYI